MDADNLYAVLRSRDRRFDGRFFVGVATTGVYCRPSCPAAMPKPENLRLYPSAAAAQQAGHRACKRCRPDAAPGSPEWNLRADVAGRAMRLIADGLVDREGVSGLAARLGYSERQLHRLLLAELGAGPQTLARAQRAQTARILLESTGLGVGEVAFAAGFASIRQFNQTIRQLYGLTPTELRSRVAGKAGKAEKAALGSVGVPSSRGVRVQVRLAYRPPLDVDALFGYLAARAVPGVEEGGAGFYRRSLRLPYGTGVVDVTDGGDHMRCELLLADVRDLAVAVRRCRVLLDLDADPREIEEVLGADPVLAPLVAARPGLRAPGHVDPAELAVRAVCGPGDELVELVERFGEPLGSPAGGVTRLFPPVAALAEVAPIAEALATGRLTLDPGADRDTAERQLRTVPGVDERTAAYIRMRALADPDVFLPTRQVRQAPASWRPWRSYALHHLWAAA
ncbi:DNA-3-methyladenine glycosylase 2 family protein [Nonomuraea sp. NEAU-A123]|uniref:DNA-3-methyladenine glycosylase 2 family protein n=1 Tax=Nonomuraea sp. NEAU-A123 TaxID=2839649 RepID=UPI001BE42569|nr:DNA-3-methyladenine glycosylase 2 family protein [Nonomuraea sp. NEAU-A123]MBT2228352.1 helix-turn-helix domain-containing protein [Nonomuraea sp. NEAU-A123]